MPALVQLAAWICVWWGAVGSVWVALALSGRGSQDDWRTRAAQSLSLGRALPGGSVPKWVLGVNATSSIRIDPVACARLKPRNALGSLDARSVYVTVKYCQFVVRATVF